ncbi:MAG: glycosyltransferase family 4 protein [Gemmatimonadales bacterium]|nr:glycosyltransferase family 4 protein [Gemmatimonadales bacterium]
MPSVMQVLHQGAGSGAVISTLHLSLGLAKAGWQVRFVCPPGSEVESLAAAEGLEVIPLQLLPRARRRNAAALAKVLAGARSDVINSHSSRDREALTWLALTRRLPVPFVATRRQIPRTVFLENWIASRLAGCMIAVSQPVADALEQRGTPRRKIAVVPNGLVAARLDVPVMPEALEHWRERIQWDPERRTIGIVSRRKDQSVVIEALSRISTPVRLVLAGVGDESAFDHLIERLPPRHAVVAIPFNSDVRPLYELLELVLLPSRMEGLSQALLEAMALGTPVAVSAAAGNLELVRDGINGLLVPPRDPVAWASAIERLLADPALRERLGSAARHTARVEFAMERTVERTAAVYRMVLRCQGPGPRADSAPEDSPWNGGAPR